MAYRNLAKNTKRFLGPTAPRKRFETSEEIVTPRTNISMRRGVSSPRHSLSNLSANTSLHHYESDVKGKFERIVPVLKKISTFQNEEYFVEKAGEIAFSELGFELPKHLIENVWVRPLDMRALFAWCVFQTYQQFSEEFFNLDPLGGAEESEQSSQFETFLSDCGFHLLDVTPCADGRLAHTIAYALRIPFSMVRRRSHAGALFDIEKTVNRWVKTEHRRYREGSPNVPTSNTRYLKTVVYHFSSVDPSHQGCAAHGSDDSVAALEGLRRLMDFRQAVENSFCCGASVDLLLIGLDTDTDSIRVHVPSNDGNVDLNKWISALEIYEETKNLEKDLAVQAIRRKVESSSSGRIEHGMVEFITRILVNNISQIDYVREFHGGAYADNGHAERFIGVGIGFKEVHLRNLTYFAHLDTVEEGAPDLDVGVKIFKGLNVSKDLPIPIVIRFDYSGRVPEAKQRAIADCQRVNSAVLSRYRKLVDDGMLYTFLTIRDRDQKGPAEVLGSSLDPVLQEEH